MNLLLEIIAVIYLFTYLFIYLLKIHYNITEYEITNENTLYLVKQQVFANPVFVCYYI